MLLLNDLMEACHDFNTGNGGNSKALVGLGLQHYVLLCGMVLALFLLAGCSPSDGSRPAQSEVSQHSYLPASAHSLSQASGDASSKRNTSSNSFKSGVESAQSSMKEEKIDAVGEAASVGGESQAPLNADSSSASDGAKAEIYSCQYFSLALPLSWSGRWSVEQYESERRDAIPEPNYGFTFFRDGNPEFVVFVQVFNHGSHEILGTTADGRSIEMLVNPDAAITAEELAFVKGTIAIVNEETQAVPSESQGTIYIATYEEACSFVVARLEEAGKPLPPHIGRNSIWGEGPYDYRVCGWGDGAGTDTWFIYDITTDGGVFDSRAQCWLNPSTMER